MPLPKELLEELSHQLDEADKQLIEVDDVVEDMRLSGMDVVKLEEKKDDLKDEIRKRRIFFQRQASKTK